MRSSRFPGFILRSYDEASTPMGMSLDRVIGFRQDLSASVRDILIFPRLATRVVVHLGSAKPSLASDHVIDGSQLLFVPAGTLHAIEGVSTLTDMARLLPSAEYMRDMLSDNRLGNEEDKFLRSRCFKLKRTRWLDDLIERYVFERVTNSSSPPGCTFFLEKQMLNELARLIFPDKLATHGEALGEETGHVLSLALTFIETNLFEDLDLERICAHVKADSSTIRRHFKEAIGTTPGAYIKDRRLDEAAALISRGDYDISDISVIIGYDSLSSFTKSFRQKFGVPPGKYRARMT